MEPTPQQIPVAAQIEERRLSFFQQHKFTLVSVVILILALIPLIVLTQMQKKSPTPIATNTTTAPTPTVALTKDNVQPTLDQAAQNVQDALDKSQADINTVSQINTSADSTSGL